MFRTSHYSRTAALIAIGLIICSLFTAPAHISGQTGAQSSTNAILDLIYRQKYNDAITALEEILERDPGNGEALTYLATAKVYQTRDFNKALDDFKAAFTAGGGATFFVTHSHEKFTTDYVADYCRGWLHLRKNGIEFTPTEGTHGFKLKYSEVEEFKINRLSNRAFHIKFSGKSQNFQGRSNTEFESLLIVALHKSFTQY